MEQIKRLDFKRIAKISLFLIIPIFIIQNLIGFLFGEGFLNKEFFSDYLIWINLVIFYYIQSFIFLMVFVYIKNSLPSKIIKAGAAYGLMVWLISNGIPAVFYLTNYFITSVDRSIIDPSFSRQVGLIEYIIEAILRIISFVLVGMTISYIHNKYMFKREVKENS